MKKIFLAITVLFITVISHAQFTSGNLTAAGLTCAMCTKAIYNALEKIPSVKNVDADIRSSAFMITFKEGASVDPDMLKEAVEDAGFSVAKLKLNGNFEHVKIEKDTHLNISGKTFHFLKVDPKELNGTFALTLVDKNYVSAREFKKYGASSNHPCVETGKAEECCAKAGAKHNSRIYHVTL